MAFFLLFTVVVMMVLVFVLVMMMVLMLVLMMMVFMFAVLAHMFVIFVYHSAFCYFPNAKVHGAPCNPVAKAT